MNAGKTLRIAAVLLAGWLAAACTASYPVVGAFDDYDEVFIGMVDHDLIRGRAFIEVKAENSGMICKDGSRVVHVPASNRVAATFLIPYCKGQKGVALLACDDGRRIAATWTADSCTTGTGDGYDQYGARFQFAFGMSEAEANARFDREAVAARDREEFPVYRPRETREEIGFATGTGFLVTADGYLVTNHHVVEDATEVFLWVDDTAIPARIVKLDPANDVALLKADTAGDPVVIARDEAPVVAEEVMALGYPMISIQGQALKATFGRVNALSGIEDDPRFLQIDVPIQPGNSGGPLLDANGRLVGVTTMTLNQVALLRQTGAVAQNVNYAVKLDYILPLIKDLPHQTHMARHKGFKELVQAYGKSVFLVVAR